MQAKVFQLQECNYRHIQDTIAMLPTAERESDPQAQPDIVKALHGITLAVTGASVAYFAVAELHGVTIGFITGTLGRFAYQDGVIGHAITVYVQPPHRSTDAAQRLCKAFADWCFAAGAAEVQHHVMSSPSADATAAVLDGNGYQSVGRIFCLKKGG